MQNQEVYSFDVEDDELSIYQHFPDSVELNIQTGKYEQAVKSVTFNIEPAPDNASVEFITCATQGANIRVWACSARGM